MRPNITFPITQQELEATQPLSIPVYLSAFLNQYRYFRLGVKLPRKLSFNLARIHARSLARIYWYRGWKEHVATWEKIWSAVQEAKP